METEKTPPSAALLDLTWSDFEPFAAIYMDGAPETRPELANYRGTMLHILLNKSIPAEDRLWAFTRGRLVTGVPEIDDRILREFAIRCVKEARPVIAARNAAAVPAPVGMVADHDALVRFAIEIITKEVFYV